MLNLFLVWSVEKASLRLTKSDYNFSFSFAVSMYDQTLINLLEEYEKPLAGGYNGKIRMAQIENIFNRADELKCIYLQWS